MCSGIALALNELPPELIERHGLGSRIHDRCGVLEVRFLHRAQDPCLPVWHEGQLLIAPWGNRRGRSVRLPRTGWTWRETVEDGGWSQVEAALVDIPATMGLENGIWYRVRHGMRGLLVPDEQGRPVAYMICESASHCYAIMTRSDRMPVLIDERIT
jgi:hypothetical protein